MSNNAIYCMAHSKTRKMWVPAAWIYPQLFSVLNVTIKVIINTLNNRNQCYELQLNVIALHCIIPLNYPQMWDDTFKIGWCVFEGVSGECEWQEQQLA